MDERIDHAALAREFAEKAAKPTATKTLTPAGIAQVHATLALAEQQRIANLIALRQADSDLLRDDEWAETEDAIREALGLS